MAFVFSWPDFDDAFTNIAREALEHALNQGEKPSNIVDTIHVRELSLGNQPPELTLLEITELSTDRFRGMFRLTYSGDAHVVLQTKVQINPVTPSHTSPHHPHSSMSRIYSHPASQKPLHVPMALKISQVQLCGTCTLVTSRKRGITLSFKNDPLQKIKVESTFDEVGGVRDMLQRDIEARLRRVCVEDLPSWVHQWSRRNFNIDDEPLSPMKPPQHPLEEKDGGRFRVGPLVMDVKRRPSVSAPTSPLTSHRRVLKSFENGNRPPLPSSSSTLTHDPKPTTARSHRNLRETQSELTPRPFSSTSYLPRPPTLMSPTSLVSGSIFASSLLKQGGLKAATGSDDSGFSGSKRSFSSVDDLNVE